LQQRIDGHRVREEKVPWPIEKACGCFCKAWQGQVREEIKDLLVVCSPTNANVKRPCHYAL